MSWKSILWFVVGIVGVMSVSVLLLWQFGNNQAKPVLDIAADARNVKGEGDIVIVEFSDFQCPACAGVQEPLKKILDKYEKKVKIVYRHFPLTSIHPYAMVSAQAAEAAGKQGKFWDMHDLLYKRQADWSKAEPRQLFIEYAKEIGLDEVKFVMDLESDEVKRIVNKDLVDATKNRLNATPSFFVNGVATSFAQIEGKIEELIK